MTISCPHCGCDFALPTAGKGKPRSYVHLKRFFAVIREARLHWPESHGFRPRSDDHLRYWLTVQAGYGKVVKTVRCETTDADILAGVLTAVMQTSEDDNQFVEVEGRTVRVVRADSIAFDEMKHLPACELFTRVDNIIRTETGLDPEILLEERRKAVGGTETAAP